MAIDEIITNEGVTVEMHFTRGNVGVLVDAIAQALNTFEIPIVIAGGGGPGGEHSYTF